MKLLALLGLFDGKLGDMREELLLDHFGDDGVRTPLLCWLSPAGAATVTWTSV